MEISEKDYLMSSGNFGVSISTKEAYISSIIQQKKDNELNDILDGYISDIQKISERIIALENKLQIKQEELCSKMPIEFLRFLNYVRNLEYDEKPHYSTLKHMFTKLLLSRNPSNLKFEWELKN